MRGRIGKYRNLFHIYLFYQFDNLYSFLLPKVKKENLKTITDEVLFSLNINLQSEGISIEVISKVIHLFLTRRSP